MYRNEQQAYLQYLSDLANKYNTTELIIERATRAFNDAEKDLTVGTILSAAFPNGCSELDAIRFFIEQSVKGCPICAGDKFLVTEQSNDSAQFIDGYFQLDKGQSNIIAVQCQNPKCEYEFHESEIETMDFHD